MHTRVTRASAHLAGNQGSAMLAIRPLPDNWLTGFLHDYLGECAHALASEALRQG